MMGKLTEPFSFLGVKWAPMNIPISRRLQTLIVFCYMYLVPFGTISCMYIFIKLIYSWIWWLALLYGIWILKDIDTCKRGGRPSDWVRNWALWRYFCEYFPIKLVKTVDLDPSRNYLFACFPHGVITISGYGAFCTNAAGWCKLFPGMTIHLATLDKLFLVPFFREALLSLGDCSCSQETLLHMLDQKKYRGNCVCVNVGGSAEAFNARPREHKLLLSKRKGFIRVAMNSGASLVPVFYFGETDLFHTPKIPENSLLRRVQEKILKLTGFSPVIYFGRGVFQYSFGWLPFRVPATVVVGAPIEVKKNLEPTSEEIDAVHAEFTKRLVTLFETEKAKYLNYHEEAQLVIP